MRVCVCARGGAGDAKKLLGLGCVIVGMFSGDIRRVWHGSDAWGYTCGVLNKLTDGTLLDLQDKPYIMHFDVSDLTATTLCVKRCVHETLSCHVFFKPVFIDAAFVDKDETHVLLFLTNVLCTKGARTKAG